MHKMIVGPLHDLKVEIACGYGERKLSDGYGASGQASPGPRDICGSLGPRQREAPSEQPHTWLANAGSCGGVPGPRPIIEGGLALQGGHRVSILLDRVGKPTDNESWPVIRNHD
jgi:hypothetical protein